MPNNMLFLSLSSQSPLSEWQRLYIKQLRLYLQIQFEFLAYVEVGLIKRPANFREQCQRKVLKAFGLVASIGQISEQAAGTVAEVIYSAVNTIVDQESQENGLQVFKRHIVEQEEGANVAIECVAREAACGWDFFLNQYQLKENSVEKFSWIGAVRIVDYCLHTGCDLTADNLWQGLIQGRSGGGFEKVSNHSLMTSSEKYDERDLTVEGAYARAGFLVLLDDGTHHFYHRKNKESNRLKLKSNQVRHLSQWVKGKRSDQVLPFVSTKLLKNGDAKYGYVQVTRQRMEDLLERYQHQIECQEVRVSRRHQNWLQMGVQSYLGNENILQTYANSIGKHQQTINNWLGYNHLQCNHPVQMVFIGEAKRINFSSGNLDHTHLAGSKLTECRLPAEMKDVYAAAADWQQVCGKNLQSVCLDLATLTQCNFNDGQWVDVWLRKTRVRSSSFERTNFMALTLGAGSVSEDWDAYSLDLLSGDNQEVLEIAVKNSQDEIRKLKADCKKFYNLLNQLIKKIDDINRQLNLEISESNHSKFIREHLSESVALTCHFSHQYIPNGLEKKVVLEKIVIARRPCNSLHIDVYLMRVIIPKQLGGFKVTRNNRGQTVRSQFLLERNFIFNNRGYTVAIAPTVDTFTCNERHVNKFNNGLLIDFYLTALS